VTQDVGLFVLATATVRLSRFMILHGRLHDEMTNLSIRIRNTMKKKKEKGKRKKEKGKKK
jgi:hypothetical protein